MGCGRWETTHLEPVDGTTVDEGGEHAQPVPEGIPDRRHGQDDMEVLFHSVDEVVIHRQRSGIHLLPLEKKIVCLLFLWIMESSFLNFDKETEGFNIEKYLHTLFNISFRVNFGILVTVRK